jgi:ubiquinone/menaquinone biosynthesis C-methylase UbiE
VVTAFAADHLRAEEGFQSPTQDYHQLGVCGTNARVSLGRRKVGLHEPSRWVFNRMADVYDARPAYPNALIDALADLARVHGHRVGDLGAGIGHVALPLAQRGLTVTAVEPAQAMLDRLRAQADEHQLAVRALHATAEALPMADASLDLVVVADALHFLDAERVGREIGRVLAPTGALAVVTCELAKTPFMQSLVKVIEAAVPRRPRNIDQNLVQISALSGVRLTRKHRYQDETPVDGATLERILRSISFIGPAMNPTRFATFCARVSALPGRPAWARTFTLRAGHRTGARARKCVLTA